MESKADKIKKGGTLGKFDLSKYKKSKGLDTGIMDKETSYIPMGSAFCKTLGVRGVAKGEVYLFSGFSNTGKTTAMLECAVGCQKSNVLPVIIDTESNARFDHMQKMGLEFDLVYNESTGETIPEGFFIYCSTKTLAREYAKKEKRKEAAIEDLVEFISDILDDQEEGKLPYDICFLWDSVGTLSSKQTNESKGENAMWDAKALGNAFKYLLSHRIPLSRKTDSQYVNTFIAIQKVYSTPAMPIPQMKYKGGEALKYMARHIYHFGGMTTSGVKALNVTVKGKTITYGIETKVKVSKNHGSDFSFEGSLISVSTGFISVDELEKYKKEKVVPKVLEILKEQEGWSDTDMSKMDMSDIKFGKVELKDDSGGDGTEDEGDSIEFGI